MWPLGSSLTDTNSFKYQADWSSSWSASALDSRFFLRRSSTDQSSDLSISDFRFVWEHSQEQAGLPDLGSGSGLVPMGCQCAGCLSNRHVWNSPWEASSTFWQNGLLLVNTTNMIHPHLSVHQTLGRQRTSTFHTALQQFLSMAPHLVASETATGENVFSWVQTGLLIIHFCLISFELEVKSALTAFSTVSGFLLSRWVSCRAAVEPGLSVLSVRAPPAAHLQHLAEGGDGSSGSLGACVSCRFQVAKRLLRDWLLRCAAPLWDQLLWRGSG